MDLEAIALTKSFGVLTILDNFNATFPERKTTCIMGPSGCGKTTLLYLLMGLMEPDSGQITGTENKRMSAVFQEDRLAPGFSGLSNVRLACERSVSDKTIIAHLEEIGLGNSWRQPVRELSGGMQRRVALVRAILAPGDLLFFDEPFKGLDAATKGETMKYLKEKTDGKTVVLVTHSADEAEFFADQLIVMPTAAIPLGL